jgi:hypothetical protein
MLAIAAGVYLPDMLDHFYRAFRKPIFIKTLILLHFKWVSSFTAYGYAVIFFAGEAGIAPRNILRVFSVSKPMSTT